MRNFVFLFYALALMVFSGQAFAATNATQWQGYADLSQAQEAASQDTLADKAQTLSIYAGRQSYTPETVVSGEDHGDSRALFDALRIGVNFKFD